MFWHKNELIFSNIHSFKVVSLPVSGFPNLYFLSDSHAMPLRIKGTSVPAPSLSVITSKNEKLHYESDIALKIL